MKALQRTDAVCQSCGRTFDADTATRLSGACDKCRGLLVPYAGRGRVPRSAPKPRAPPVPKPPVVRAVRPPRAPPVEKSPGPLPLPERGTSRAPRVPLADGHVRARGSASSYGRVRVADVDAVAPPPPRPEGKVSRNAAGTLGLTPTVPIPPPARKPGKKKTSARGEGFIVVDATEPQERAFIPEWDAYGRD